MDYTAVLFSGGLDSAVLAADALTGGPAHALHVSVGFAWEAEELAMAARLFARPPFAGRIEPPVGLRFDMLDVFPPTHWAVRGEPPAFDTPDEDVYLTGRNIILLTKASIYCAQHGIARLAQGSLAHNPFPDAAPEFFTAMGRALTLGLAPDIDIVTPLAQ